MSKKLKIFVSNEEEFNKAQEYLLSQGFSNGMYGHKQYLGSNLCTYQRYISTLTNDEFKEYKAEEVFIDDI